MNAIAKCPKCDKGLSEINFAPILLKGESENHNGTAYSCPHCQTLIHMGPDLALFVADIVDNVVNNISQVLMTRK